MKKLKHILSISGWSFGILAIIFNFFKFSRLAYIATTLFFILLLINLYGKTGEYRDNFNKVRIEISRGDAKDIKKWINQEKHTFVSYIPLFSIILFYISVVILGFIMYIPLIFLVVAIFSVFKNNPYAIITLISGGLFVIVPTFRLLTYTKFLIIRKFDIAIYYIKQLSIETNEKKFKKLQNVILYQKNEFLQLKNQCHHQEVNILQANN